jgi:hypothetical protein
MKIKNKLLYSFLVIVIATITITLTGCKDKKKFEIVIIPDAQKTQLERANLFGKIKIIKTDSYNTHSKDSLDKQHLVSTVYQHFSADGSLLKLVILNSNNDTIRKRVVQYNDDGKEISWNEWEYQNNRKSSCLFKYDINGYISSEEYYIQDTLYYTIQYKTDGIGSIIEMNKVKQDITIKNILSYNENGLLIKNNEYDPNGKLFKYIVYEYDNYGDEVNKKVFNTFNALIEFTFTQYDQKGRVQKILYENMEHGLKDTKHYTQHDQKGNWNFEIQVSNNDTLFFRKREITYY